MIGMVSRRLVPSAFWRGMGRMSVTTDSSLFWKEDLYSILKIPSSADAKQVKQAFFAHARVYHPDALPAAGSTAAQAMMAGSEEEAEAERALMFIRGQLAFDVFSDPERRQSYDRARGVVSNRPAYHNDDDSSFLRRRGRRRGAWTPRGGGGGGHFPWKHDGPSATASAAPNTPPPEAQDTPVQARIRVLVSNGEPDAAVAAWASEGQAGVELLLWLLNMCRVYKQAPNDLTSLFAALHRSEPSSQLGALRGSATIEEGLSVFGQTKTKAYNDLICVCNARPGGDSSDQVFKVIEEMDRRGVPKDLETLALLEERFTFFPPPM